MFTKFYTTEDIKYNTGRKAVAEVASHNSLEKVSRKGLDKKVHMASTPVLKNTSNIKYNLSFYTVRKIKCHVHK